MSALSTFRNVFWFLLILLLSDCGVKGDPVPYISVHSEKPAATPAPGAKK